MGKWIGPTGNTVTILPWTDKGFKFYVLDCREVLGGDIACGSIKMMHDGNEEALKMITDENTVEIRLGSLELGDTMTIKGIITNRKYHKNLLDIEFSCIPDLDFVINRGTLSYNDIDTAIKSLWRGEIDNRTSTDLPSGIELNQAGEKDRDFLRTLCESYKKDTIYAFGLEGLLIKDIVGIDSTGHKEPYWTVLGGADMIQDKGPGNDRYRLNYDYRLYLKPEDPWETPVSKNLGTRIFDNKYMITHSDYTIMRENLYNNQRILNSKMYNQLHLIHTNFFQSYRLGDVVNYKRAGESDKVPFVIYIISEIWYHYRTEPDPGSGESETFPFKIEYTLHCLEESGKILNDKDPLR